jgi:GntR family transcriptional regulator, transcriptional repressor for pyruvate dehydrogenase complex
MIKSRQKPRTKTPHQGDLEAVRGVRLYESVLEAIKQFVEAGNVLPGNAFPAERTLETQLRVSRPVLREAFRVLEASGMVQTRPGGGRYLVHSSFPDVEFWRKAKLRNNASTLFALWDARESVECSAAFLAAQQRSETQLGAIERPIAMIGRVDPAKYRKADFNLDFHVAIAQASGNPFLEKLVKVLIDDFRRLDFKLLVPADEWNDLQGNHRAIFEAIRDRKAEAAALAMREHFEELRRSVRSHQH